MKKYLRLLIPDLNVVNFIISKDLLENRIKDGAVCSIPYPIT